MYMIEETISYSLTFEETVRRLAAAPTVEGLAIFGSRPNNQENPVSDFDLLVLINAQPVAIFQLFTHIDGRMADIVIIHSETVARLLGLDETVTLRSAEGMLVHKVWGAEIVYDPSGLLNRLQLHVHRRSTVTDWLHFASEQEQYSTWFWQNHGLAHVKRMSQSTDPIYLTAADMMLMTGLAGLCRSYFVARQLLWEGEKAALRYLQEHDPNFLLAFQACFAMVDRKTKVAHFEQLLATALAPIAPLWNDGVAAVYLQDPAAMPTQVADALTHWESLLAG